MIIHKVVGRREILYWDKPHRSMCGEPGATKWNWKYVTCEACLKFKKEPVEY